MKTAVRFVVVCFAALAFASNACAADTYTFDQNHSHIGFEVRHLLGTARGQFHRFAGTIDFDREKPERSSVTAKIDVQSIDTGIDKRDNHLRSADFFNVAKFPQITFRSSSVRRTGDQAGDITGDFSMHGVTRPIVLHVQLVESNENRTRWKVTTPPLKRKDFGLSFGGTAETVSGIGQDVTVHMEIEAKRAK